MKAYVLEEINKLVYKEVPMPFCPQGWAIVQVKAAGICSSDIARIFEKGTYHFPTIPGHEFSGVVIEVSDKKNRSLIGKKVGVFPLIPCKKCLQCSQGKYETCNNYDYIGSRRDGGFAEYVVVPVWNLIELPENLSFTTAALMEPLAVSLHAVKKLLPVKGKNIAIIGTGMIAFASAQWLLSYGASSITIIGRSEQKRKIAESIKGVKYAVLGESIQEFECVLEAVGSNSSIETSLNLVKAGGKIVLMGNPVGNILLSQKTYWKILRKQLTLVGTWNSSYVKEGPSDWAEVLSALENKILQTENLVSHIFKQDQLLNALNLMREHKASYCKIITLWNEEKHI